MIFFNKSLTKQELEEVQKEFGDYVKITIDLDNKWVVIGCELHADGEKILLKKGSNQDKIWGGGINFKDKMIDTTAVLNLRPRLGNDSMEILDTQNREKFVNILKEYFKEVWH